MFHKDPSYNGSGAKINPHTKKFINQGENF